MTKLHNKKFKTLIHDQKENATKTYSVPDRRDNRPVEAIKQLIHDKQ